VNTPEIGDKIAGGFMTLAGCPQTWEHVGVMASAVETLDAGGIGAGNPQLERLKTP
jgi:hypothetical protein